MSQNVFKLSMKTLINHRQWLVYGICLWSLLGSASLNLYLCIILSDL